MASEAVNRGAPGAGAALWGAGPKSPFARTCGVSIDRLEAVLAKGGEVDCEVDGVEGSLADLFS